MIKMSGMSNDDALLAYQVSKQSSAGLHFLKCCTEEMLDCPLG